MCTFCCRYTFYLLMLVYRNMKVTCSAFTGRGKTKVNNVINYMYHPRTRTAQYMEYQSSRTCVTVGARAAGRLSHTPEAGSAALLHGYARVVIPTVTPVLGYVRTIKLDL